MNSLKMITISRHCSRNVPFAGGTRVPEGNLFREAATDFSELCEDISQTKACQGIPYRGRLLLAPPLIAM
jgi:hypothetical protein